MLGIVGSVLGSVVTSVVCGMVGSKAGDVVGSMVTSMVGGVVDAAVGSDVHGNVGSVVGSDVAGEVGNVVSAVVSGVVGVVVGTEDGSVTGRDAVGSVSGGRITVVSRWHPAIRTARAANRNSMFLMWSISAAPFFYILAQFLRLVTCELGFWLDRSRHLYDKAETVYRRRKRRKSGLTNEGNRAIILG